MKKETLFLVCLVCLVCFFILGANFSLSKAKAQTDPFANLVYPISELDNCANRGACETFCALIENRAVCLDFAEAKNLLPKKDIEMGRKMLELGENIGPGGCSSMTECKNYCDEIANIKECIIFAEKNGLLPVEEIDEAKKVIQAIDKGLTPPPCRGKSECDVYCSETAHMEECITFGEAAGLIPPEELKDAKKMLKAIKAGAAPPPCHGKNECDVYCSLPENMIQCMEFALAAGFMPEQEAVQAKKMLKVIKQGIKPPNCRGEQECQAYCQEEARFTECVNFAEAMGDMSQKDADRARKTGGKGPGGCKGEEECQNFCDNPENINACLEFAVLIGEMSAEEAQRILEGNQENMEPNMMGPGQNMPAGPGGCQSPDECMNYCSNPSNQQECANFGGQAGPATQPIMTPDKQIMPGQMPPEGYTPQEGQQYQMPPEGYNAPPENYGPIEGMGFGEAPRTITPEAQNMPPADYKFPENQMAQPQNQTGPMPMTEPMPQTPIAPPPAGQPSPEPMPTTEPIFTPEPQSFLWPLQLFLSNILTGFGF